jgi:hypothetical protein
MFECPVSHVNQSECERDLDNRANTIRPTAQRHTARLSSNGDRVAGFRYAQLMTETQEKCYSEEPRTILSRNDSD